MADKLYIPRKDVDYYTISRLQRDLEQAGFKAMQARDVAEAVANHTITNNRDRWLEIERWANRNVTPALNTQYDCTVDASQTSDNLGTLVFTNVASAISTMFSLGFTTQLRIGFQPRWNTGTQLGIAAKDSVALTNANVPHTVSIWNINGAQVGGTNSSIPADQGDGCVWDVNGQAHTLTNALVDLELHDITLINNGTARQNFFGVNANIRVIAHGCDFEGVGATATTAVALTIGNCYATECVFHDVNVLGSATWLANCMFNCNVTSTIQTWGANPGWFVATDCLWSPSTGGPNPWPFQILCNTVLVLGGSCSLNNWRNGNTGNQRTELRIAGSGVLLYVEIASGTLASQPLQWMDINVTGTLDTTRLDGTFGKLTITAPLANQNRVGHVICGTCLTTSDITGPCVLNLAVGHVNVLNGNSLTLRGSGCTGIVRVEGSGGAGAIGLNMVGCTDGNIQASGNLAPTVGAGTQKGWAIDAASARCILDFAGATQFPVAGTDAGAVDIVRFT